MKLFTQIITFSFIMLSFYINLSAQDQGDRWWHYEYDVFLYSKSKVVNLFEVEDTFYAIGEEGVGDLGVRLAIYKIDQKGTLVDVDSIETLGLENRTVTYNSNKKEFLFSGFYVARGTPGINYHISAVDLQGNITYSEIVDLGFETAKTSYTFPIDIYPHDEGYVLYGVVNWFPDNTQDNVDGMLIFLDKNYQLISKYMLEDVAWGAVCHVYENKNGQLKAIFSKNLERDRLGPDMAYYTVDIDPTYFWKDSVLFYKGSLDHNAGGGWRGESDFIVNTATNNIYPMGFEAESDRRYEGLLYAGMDSTGEMLWSFTARDLQDLLWLDTPALFANKVSIYNHTQCLNGDLLYIGEVIFTDSDNSNWDVVHPFAMRVASDGSIKWIRAFDKLNSHGVHYGLEFSWELYDVVEDSTTGDLTFWGLRQVSFPIWAIRPFILKVDSNGCMGDELGCSRVQPILVSSEDVIETTKQEIKVYPNPSVHQLMIEHNYIGQVEVQLIDASGMLKETQKFTNKKISIDVSSYASGIYFVNVYKRQGELISSHKIIIQR